jgi:hypothetical protein
MSRPRKPRLPVIDGQAWTRPRLFTLTVIQASLEDDLAAEWRADPGWLAVEESLPGVEQLWPIEDMCRRILTGRSEFARAARPELRALWSDAESTSHVHRRSRVLGQSGSCPG